MSGEQGAGTRSRRRIAWLVLLCALGGGWAAPWAQAAAPAEQPKPVGFLIDLLPSDPGQWEKQRNAAPEATVLRGAKKISARNGLAVYAGDVIQTTKQSTVAVAFRDESAVTLRAAATLRIQDYAYPALLRPTHVSLEAGAAFFDIKKRPAKAHFFVQTRAGPIEVKGTKFQLVTKFNSGTGNFTTDVLLISGTITTTDIGGNQHEINATDLLASVNPKMLTLNLTSSGDTLAPTIAFSSLTRAARRALRYGAVSVATVTKNNKGVLVIVTNSRAPDGTFRKTFHRESANGNFITRTRFESLGKSGRTIIRSATSATTGNRTTRIIVISNDTFDGRVRLRETRVEDPVTGNLVSGTFTKTFIATDGTKERRTFTGTTAQVGSDVVITGTESGRDANGVAFSTPETITRRTVGGNQVEILNRTGATGGAPAFERVTTQPDGSRIVETWNSPTANINADPPDTSFTTPPADGGGAPSFTTPGGAVFVPGEEPRVSP